MAGYSVRSLTDLSQAARKYFTQSLDGAVASVWPNTFTITAKVLALLGQGLELRRAWLVRQIFASTAGKTWLVRHGFELGLALDPAVAAIGQASGPAPSGLIVPALLQYTRGDGAVFNVLAAATAANGAVSLNLSADAPGSTGNTDAGTTLALVDPSDAPTGTPATITVTAAADGSGLSGGADEEQTEAFRARVLARKRRRAQGGNDGDYEEWLREAVGSAVASVFVDSFQNDARAVWVAFTVTPPGVDASDPAAVLQAYQTNPAAILPTPAQMATAQAYLNDPVRRPVQARVVVVGLIPVSVPLTVTRLVPDTPDVRAALAAELAATFLDRAAPGLPSAPFTLSHSWLDEAVSRATGEDSHVLPVPAGDIVFLAGQLPLYSPPTYA